MDPCQNPCQSPKRLELLFGVVALAFTAVFVVQYESSQLNDRKVLADFESVPKPMRSISTARVHQSKTHRTRIHVVNTTSYFRDTMIHPATHGITLLPVIQPATTLALGAFNPGIIRLSVKELAAIADVFPTARYFASFRRSGTGDQCTRFAQEMPPPSPFLGQQGGKLQRGQGLSLFAILNASLEVVGNVTLTSFIGEDVRLQHVSGGIVTTCMTYGRRIDRTWDAGWHASALELFVKGNQQKKVFARVSKHPSISSLITGSCNLGVVNDKKTSLVVWLSQPLTVVPADVTELPEDLTPPTVLLSNLTISRGPEEFEVHNNLSPIDLPGDQNQMLLVGHVHGPSGWAPGVHKPRYGSLYGHLFVLAEKVPPYRVLAQSAPWCVPAPSQPLLCKLIQYVVSLLLSEDGSDLIIGFGVLDCDARVLRFPLAHALAMTNQTVRFGNLDGVDLAKMRPGAEFAARIASGRWPRPDTAVALLKIKEWVVDMESVRAAVQSLDGCLVYAFGVAARDPYIEAMATAGCHLFAFDPTLNHERDWMPNVTFYPWGVGSSTTATTLKLAVNGAILTLPEVMRRLGHDDGRRITAMKLDCEGCEWAAFQEMVVSGLTNLVLNLATEFHFASDSREVEDRDIGRFLSAQEFLTNSSCTQMQYDRNRRSKWNLRPRIHPALKQARLPKGVCCYKMAFRCGK